MPRDRVFIDANRDAYNTVMTTGWYPNVMQQTMIRAQTKLEFAYGLAMRMAEIINDVSPATKQMLGEISVYAELTRAAIVAAEDQAFEWGNGVWFPHGGPLASLRAILPTWFPRVGEIITLIGSHNLLAAPTRAQLDDRSLRPLIDQFLRGAKECLPRNARACFASRGISSAPRSRAATNFMSASISRRVRATISSRTRCR